MLKCADPTIGHNGVKGYFCDREAGHDGFHHAFDDIFGWPLYWIGTPPNSSAALEGEHAERRLENAAAVTGVPIWLLRTAVAIIVQRGACDSLDAVHRLAYNLEALSGLRLVR